MGLIRWALEHHIQSVLMDLLVLWFVASVLRQRRPTGSAIAWLLAILLIPYLGIPLYLIFGGRKFHAKAASKGNIAVSATSRAPTGDQLGLGWGESAQRIDWLDDGVKAYQVFLREIEQARHSIHIATYLLGNDPTGISLVHAMTRKAREGVEVCLLLDDLLSFKAPEASLVELQQAGGKVARFMPLLHIPFRGQANLRNHRKMAVFDGARAIVGGMNLAEEYMGAHPLPTRWKDLCLLLQGHAAITLDEIFLADWKFAASQTLTLAKSEQTQGSIPLRVVPSGPDSLSDPIYDAMLTLVFRAQRRLFIATPYFAPDDPLTRGLEVAIRRGVQVTIIVPAKSNHLLADLAGGPYLRELADAGAQVHRTQCMLHAKAILADDTVAAVGSANFDMRSLFLDYEISLFLTGPAEISFVANWFDQLLKSCISGPPVAGLLRGLVESVARLLAPLI